MRFHRTIHSLSQAQLAGILGYDKTYISALETGKRALDDVGSLRRVCARAATLPLLARAAGATGDARLFDQVMRECKVLLEQAGHTSLFNPFALHEIQLRGMIATGRADIAIRLAANGPAHTSTVAPQWRVIELVTIAHVHLLAGDRDTARQALDTAIQEATLHRLPHQLQRITRIAVDLLPDTRIAASQALEWLREELAA